MNVQDFKIFADIVRYHNFSRAARENRVSQSAVSQTVSRIEKSFNCRLIDRSVRPFVLTVSGRRFYDGCKRILALYDSIRTEVMLGESGVAGIVRVAAIYSVGLVEMNRFTQQFMRLNPAAKFRLNYVRPNLIYQMVEEDEIDIGVISYPTPHPKITILPWRNEEMALICHPDHPLAMQSRISPSQLQDEKMIAFDSDLSIRKEIDKWLGRHNVTVENVIEFDNVENIKQAIEIKAGVSILPIPTVDRDIHHRYLAIVPLEERELVRPVAIVHLKQKPLSAISKSFIEFLMESNTRESSLSGMGLS